MKLPLSHHEQTGQTSSQPWKLCGRHRIQAWTDYGEAGITRDSERERSGREADGHQREYETRVTLPFKFMWIRKRLIFGYPDPEEWNGLQQKRPGSCGRRDEGWDVIKQTKSLQHLTYLLNLRCEEHNHRLSEKTSCARRCWTLCLSCWISFISNINIATGCKSIVEWWCPEQRMTSSSLCRNLIFSSLVKQVVWSNINEFYFHVTSVVLPFDSAATVDSSQLKLCCL